MFNFIRFFQKKKNNVPHLSERTQYEMGCICEKEEINNKDFLKLVKKRKGKTTYAQAIRFLFHYHTHAQKKARHKRAVDDQQD